MTWLLDVTSLMVRSHIPVMTGIDRVETMIAETFIQNALSGSEAAFFMFRDRYISRVIDANMMAALLAEMRTVRGMDQPANSELSSLLAYLDGPPQASHRCGAMRFQVQQPRKRSRLFMRGSALLTALKLGQSFSAFRAQHRGPIRYVYASQQGFRNLNTARWLQDSDNTSLIVYFHDLIPINSPRYASEGARRSLIAGLSMASVRAERIWVNSAATKADVESYFFDEQIRCPPVTVYRPDITRRSPASVWGGGTERLGCHPYFLCAGTIEGRKNITLLLSVWRRLAQRHDRAVLPRLVLAGQRGWSNADVLRDLDMMEDIGDLVVEATGFNDAALGEMMRRARAVLIPSWTEGFSMVMAEAKAIGVPVLASDIPAHQEMLPSTGGLLDPLDQNQWLQRIESTIAERNEWTIRNPD